MRRLMALGLACASACSIAVERGEHEAGSTTGEAVESSDGPEREPRGESSDGGETEGLGCAPSPMSSCADAHAPQVRALEPGEVLGISTRDGIRNLVFATEIVTREIPEPRHSGYIGLFLFGLPEIRVPLSPATAGRLEDLRAALPASPGPYGGWHDATIRAADRQACFAVEEDCPAFDDLYAFATRLDAQILEAWHAGDSGTLHVIEEIEPTPWPLDVEWGDGGEIEIDEYAWESLEDSWFHDDDGRLAHVGRACTGGDDGCTRWTIDVSLLRVADSPLDDDAHRRILDAAGGWLGLLAPFGVDAPAFAEIRDAHVLTFAGPDAPDTIHHVTMFALPELTLDEPV
jgi:hypothetical protein